MRWIGPVGGVVAVCAVLALGCGASTGAKKGRTGPEPSADEAGDTDNGDTENGASTESTDASAGDSSAGLPDFGDSPGEPGPDTADAAAGDGAGAGAKPAAASMDPHQGRFKTKVPPAKMSEFLVGPAAEAMKKRQWARAVALYQALVVARGDASPEALELSKAWTLLGQNDDAIAVLDRFIAASDDVKAIQKAKKERDRLAVGGKLHHSDGDHQSLVEVAGVDLLERRGAGHLHAQRAPAVRRAQMLGHERRSHGLVVEQVDRSLADLSLARVEEVHEAGPTRDDGPPRDLARGFEVGHSKLVHPRLSERGARAVEGRGRRDRDLHVVPPLE